MFINFVFSGFTLGNKMKPNYYHTLSRLPSYQIMCDSELSNNMNSILKSGSLTRSHHNMKQSTV
jgi:hypothetical protein